MVYISSYGRATGSLKRHETSPTHFQPPNERKNKSMKNNKSGIYPYTQATKVSIE